MAGRYSLDPGQTPRTILRRVLDTVDTRSPRRRRSTQTKYVRVLTEEWWLCLPVRKEKLSLGGVRIAEL